MEASYFTVLLHSGRRGKGTALPLVTAGRRKAQPSLDVGGSLVETQGLGMLRMEN